MGSLFQRKGSSVWYMTYWDPIKQKWTQHPTGQKRKADAQKVLKDMEAMQRRRAAIAGVDGGAFSPAGPTRHGVRRVETLVGEAVEDWLSERAKGNRANHSNEAAHLRNHFLPSFAALPLTAVRPRLIRTWVRDLESKQPAPGKGPTAGHVPQDERTLAPRTVRKIYGTVRKMFEDFVADELVPKSPCKLKSEDLPPDVDRDPEWRESAFYSVEEIELLISDPRVPEHRRMFYAISFLTGSRHGEVAALRFRHLDTSGEPLQRLMVARSYGGRTKTKVTKRVPVHPTLAAMLAEWKLGGYQRWAGRMWTADDLLVPGPVPRTRKNLRGDPAVMLTRHTSYKRLVNADLPTLGLRHRRLHDMRHGFITLATECGAKYEDVKLITHAPPKAAFDQYVRVGWKRLCEAVLCIDVKRRAVLKRVKGEDE